MATLGQKRTSESERLPGTLMTSHRLFDSFMNPEQPPDCSYTPDANVISVRAASEIPATAEIFQRSSGTYGFRFQAWVAWRDAGGAIRSHSWHEIVAKDPFFTDLVAEAQFAADAYAASTGITLAGIWHSPS